MLKLVFSGHILLVLLLGFADRLHAAEESVWLFHVDLHSGVGFFQAIRPPAARVMGLENQPVKPIEQTGLPLRFQFNVSYRLGDRSELRFGSGLTHISSFAAGDAALDALYRRIDFYPGLSFAFPYYKFRPSLILDLNYRIVDFTNISTGHYVEAILPRFGVRLALHPLWSIETMASVSALAEYGYNDGSKRNPLSLSETNASTISGQIGYKLSSEANLYLGYDREVYHIDIANMAAYEDFGFQVAPQDRVRRTYRLSTNVISFGVRRTW